MLIASGQTTKIGTKEEIPIVLEKETTGDYPKAVGFGSYGKSVETVQKFLKEEGSFTAPFATGYFGTKTKEAVTNFQSKYGIPSTGMIDKPTLEKIQQLAPQIAPSLQTQTKQIGQ